jgi:hypothetical protein
MSTSSVARPSKIYPNLDFWFENKPSGNPGWVGSFTFKRSSLLILPVVVGQVIYVSS